MCIRDRPKDAAGNCSYYQESNPYWVDYQLAMDLSLIHICSGGVPTPGQSGSVDDEDDNGLQQGKQAVEEDLSSQLPKACLLYTSR